MPCLARVSSPTRVSLASLLGASRYPQDKYIQSSDGVYGIELGEFVTAQGWLGEYRDVRQINCQSVVPDSDPNAECYSWLRTIQIGRDVYSKRGGGSGDAGGSGSGGGAQSTAPRRPPGSLAKSLSAAAAAAAAASDTPPTMTLARLEAASAKPVHSASPEALEVLWVQNGVETVTADDIASAIPGGTPVTSPAFSRLLDGLIAAGVVFATATATATSLPSAATFTVVCNPTVLGPVLVGLVGSGYGTFRLNLYRFDLSSWICVGIHSCRALPCPVCA